MLLSLDLQNAFDSLSWDYLFFTLERYGFGTNFLTTLKAFYSEPTAQLSVKGYSSQPINIHRGTI